MTDNNTAITIKLNPGSRVYYEDYVDYEDSYEDYGEDASKQ